MKHTLIHIYKQDSGVGGLCKYSSTQGQIYMTKVATPALTINPVLQIFYTLEVSIFTKLSVTKICKI